MDNFLYSDVSKGQKKCMKGLKLQKSKLKLTTGKLPIHARILKKCLPTSVVEYRYQKNELYPHLKQKSHLTYASVYNINN